MDLGAYKVMEEDVDAVYLSWRELSLIYHLDLSDSRNLEKYRDLFVLGCLTGFRFISVIILILNPKKSEVECYMSIRIKHIQLWFYRCYHAYSLNVKADDRTTPLQGYGSA